MSQMKKFQKSNVLNNQFSENKIHSQNQTTKKISDNPLAVSDYYPSQKDQNMSQNLKISSFNPMQQILSQTELTNSKKVIDFKINSLTEVFYVLNDDFILTIYSKEQSVIDEIVLKETHLSESF